MAPKSTDKLPEGFIEVPIEKLVPADWNYKTEKPELVEKLKNNLKRNGQIENILIRELKTGFYEVVNGNHRYVALKDLEWKSVICFNLGEISDSKAKRIAIETNETKFSADPLKLAALIADILQDFPVEDISSTMPYSEEEIENFKNVSDFNWEDHNPPKPPDPEEPQTRIVTCPHCHKDFEIEA